MGPWTSRRVPRSLSLGLLALGAACLLAGVPGCQEGGRGGGRVQKIHVGHHLVPAMGVGPCLCLLVDEGNGPQCFFGGIEGFAFAWGTECDLTVRVEEVRDPPADGSSLRYTLVSVDKATRVPKGTRFAVVVFDREFVQGQSLLGGRRFDCASDEVRRELDRRLASLAAQQGSFRAEFSHPADPAEPLVLEAVGDARR